MKKPKKTKQQPAVAFDIALRQLTVTLPPEATLADVSAIVGVVRAHKWGGR